MIPPLYQPNLITVSILSYLILLFVFIFVSTLQIATMKVHPVAMKRNVTIRDDFDSQSSETSQTLTLMAGNPQKKLRRLPHVFSKVLELPFPSNADVSVQESSDCFRFVAEIYDDLAGIGDDVRAHAVEIHPGATKIVVRGGGAGGDGGGEVVELLLDQLKVDVWRFRLPELTRPELATALFVDGELIVTVPKGGGGDFEDGREVWGGVGRLVPVQ